jgi:hypothetical protein
MSVSTTPLGGVGISLGYKISPATSFTSLVQLRDDAEFSGFETAVIPITTLASQTVSKVPGRTDNGTFTGSVWLVPGDTGVAELLTLAQAKTTVIWQLQLVDGTSSTTGSTYQFSGFVSTITPGNFTGEDAPTQEFTIAISGAVTFAIGT